MSNTRTKILLLTTAGSIPLANSHFGRGSTPILAAFFQCSGNEDNLTDCSHTSLSPSSSSYRTADVASAICQGNASQPECTTGEIRLMNGSGAEEGRVELCHEGFWRTICDQNWSQEEAVVVCTQLGLPKLGENQDFMHLSI